MAASRTVDDMPCCLPETTARATVHDPFRFRRAGSLFAGPGLDDHNPSQGRTATTLDAVRDNVIAMKRHSVNAARTSHYLHDERFLDLCDVLRFARPR